MSRFILLLAVYCCALGSWAAEVSPPSAAVTKTTPAPVKTPAAVDTAVAKSTLAVNPAIGAQIEDLKKASIELNRDLMLLEEDLLFPASTQIAVYVSLDVGHYFALDSVKLTIDGQMVSSYLYTPKQISALARGGVQRLYLGNLKTGSHEITAFFIGKGPEERDYKRGATYNFNKTQKPGMLEIRIKDETGAMQPTFEFKEWQL
ncbi:MAG TPA: AraC family transcriptional regulator [Cellvibrionaceae bacterium]